MDGVEVMMDLLLGFSGRPCSLSEGGPDRIGCQDAFDGFKESRCVGPGGIKSCKSNA